MRTMRTDARRPSSRHLFLLLYHLLPVIIIQINYMEQLVRMMEVVAQMIGKTDMYQREALIDLATSMLDRNTRRMLENIHLRR